MRRFTTSLLVCAAGLVLAAGMTAPLLPRSAAASPAPGVVSISNGSLTLNGQAWRPIGFDAYQAATWWATNVGCGGQIDDLDALMRSVPPNGLIRFSAFQALGTNTKAGALDFTGIDRVVAAAARDGRKVSLVLAGQDGTCDDGHWRDQQWYQSGYRLAFDDLHRGVTPLSYWSWLHAIVSRYRGNPAVAMWEPVGEPEPTNCAAGLTGSRCWGHLTCPATAAATLRTFFDTVGGELHRIDPTHLVAAGLIGGGQCGSAGPDYQRAVSSAGIDVASFHDYGAPTQPVPTVLQNDIAMATAVHRPLLVEESGINGRDMAGCLNASTRATFFYDKILGAFGAGAQGYAVWDWSADDPGTCDMYIRPNDPLRALYATWGAG